MNAVWLYDTNYGNIAWPPDGGNVPSLPGHYDYAEYASGVLVKNYEGDNINGLPPLTHSLPVNGYFKHISGNGVYPNLEGWNVPPIWSDVAQYVVKLFTGGKALRQDKSLFELGESLTWFERDGLSEFDNYGSVPSQQIALDSQGTLGSDGNLYAMLSKGQDVVITPRTTQPYSLVEGSLPSVTPLTKLVRFLVAPVPSDDVKSSFNTKDIQNLLQFEISSNVFDNPPPGHDVQVRVQIGLWNGSVGWNGNTYINRVTWDLGGSICAARGTISQGKIQINPGKIMELDAQFSRTVSAQTWVNIFAHEGIWGNAGGNGDCNPYYPFDTCETGEISAGTLGVPAYLYDPYFVLPSSRTTLRSDFGF